MRANVTSLRRVPKLHLPKWANFVGRPAIKQVLPADKSVGRWLAAAENKRYMQIKRREINPRPTIKGVRTISVLSLTENTLKLSLPLRASEVIFDSEVHFVSEVSPAAK